MTHRGGVVRREPIGRPHDSQARHPLRVWFFYAVAFCPRTDCSGQNEFVHTYRVTP